jgi:sugar O-acyltransferase (sialic acid O-acetyltransferase NeuD family)
MSKVVIFGNEKLAQLAYFYLTHDSSHQVCAFTVDRDYQKERQFQGLPVVPFEEVEDHYPPTDYRMFIAIGYRKLNTLRAGKYAEAKRRGYELISYVSSKAVLWGDTKIGDNCFILENQVIQPFVEIGNNVVLWSGNHFGHNVVVGDHCWLASHIVISGGVTIEPYCFVGVNASFRDNVRIGRESIIGAGALILGDVKEKSVYIAKQTDLYRLNSEMFENMMDISNKR